MGKRIVDEVVNIVIALIGVKLLPLSMIKICAYLTPNKIDNFLCPPNGQFLPGRVSVFAVHNVFQVLATLGVLLPCHLDKYLRFSDWFLDGDTRAIPSFATIAFFHFEFG